MRDFLEWLSRSKALSVVLFSILLAGGLFISAIFVTIYLMASGLVVLALALWIVIPALVLFALYKNDRRK